FAAWATASPTARGGLKSGSPALKLRTCLPSARSSPARLETARVAEGLMRAARVEMGACITVGPTRNGSAAARGEPVRSRGRARGEAPAATRPPPLYRERARA